MTLWEKKYKRESQLKIVHSPFIFEFDKQLRKKWLTKTWSCILRRCILQSMCELGVIVRLKIKDQVLQTTQSSDKKQ